MVKSSDLQLVSTPLSSLPKHANLRAGIVHIGPLYFLRQFCFAERVVSSEHLNFISFLFGIVPCVYFLLNAKRLPSMFCDVVVEHLRGIATRRNFPFTPANASSRSVKSRRLYLS